MEIAAQAHEVEGTGLRRRVVRSRDTVEAVERVGVTTRYCTNNLRWVTQDAAGAKGRKESLDESLESSCYCRHPDPMRGHI